YQIFQKTSRNDAGKFSQRTCGLSLILQNKNDNPTTISNTYMKAMDSENKGGQQGPYLLTKNQAALKARCPRCRTGALFVGNTYGKGSQKMHANCPHCNLRYEREPGYFYVAMFVSYAF